MTVDKDPLLTAAEAAEKLRVKLHCLANWRCRGLGPRFVKVGKAVYYRQSALDNWLVAQEREPRKASARAA